MIKSCDEIIAEAQSHINCVDVAAAKALYDSDEDVVLLDVRERHSVEKSKLQDSVNISRGLLEMKIEKLCSDPNTLILIHCGGGGRASLAALTLQEMGYVNVYAITAKYDDIKSVFS